MENNKRQYSFRIGYTDNPQTNEVDTNHSIWKIHGRTNKVVDFNGNQEIHDFSGMTCADRITLDLEHSLEDVVGYADSITVDGAELVMDGHVFRDLPAGDKVYRMLKDGVPLQASVTFTYDVTEEVPEKEIAEVNGTSIEGPVTIYRRWKLESIAVCRYGVDDSTFISVFNKKGEKMTINKKKFSEGDPEEEKKEGMSEENENQEQQSDENSENDETSRIDALEQSLAKLSEVVDGLVEKQNEGMAEGDEPEPTEDKPEEQSDDEEKKEELSKKLDAIEKKMNEAIKLFSKGMGAEPPKPHTKKYSNPYEELADIERQKLNQK